MTQKEFSWETPKGEKIYGKQWSLAAPKAVIAMVHGLGEHINRYHHVAEFFTKNGYAFVGFDHLGHGQSAGKRGHVPSYDYLLNEVDMLLSHVEKAFPKLPIFLYGHSLGGNVVLNYHFKRKNSLKGVIATGAAITLPNPPPALLLFVGKLMRKISPSFSQPNGLKVEALSRDKAVVEAYITDPLVHNKVSSELGLSLIEQGLWLIKEARTSPCPLLIMHGESDEITASDGSAELAELTTGDVTLKVWEDLYHEIHNEPEQQDIFNYTLKWLEERLNT